MSTLLLDTHAWVWWASRPERLSRSQRTAIERARKRTSEPLLLSIISCWEVAKLVELGRLALALPVLEWLEQALAYPGIRLLDLTPQIAVASTELPGEFHRDPADQILVATARAYDVPLLTVDRRILDYPHLRIAK